MALQPEEMTGPGAAGRARVPTAILVVLLAGAEIRGKSRSVGYDAIPRMLPLVIQIEKTKERTAETCAFAQSPVRIGRNPLNDVELDDGYVSQWHGVIRFDETHTTYLDLGSTNPSLVDGKPIERNVEIPITEGTDLRIGSFRLHVIRVDAPPELFGARRKTAFARTGVGDASSVAATMFFGGEPTKLRSKSSMHELFASARASGALSGPPPAYAPQSQPPGPSGSGVSPQSGTQPVQQPPMFSQHLAPIVQPPPLVSHPPPAYPAADRGSGPMPPVAAGEAARPSGSPPPLPGTGGAGLSAMSSASLRAASVAPTVAVAVSQPPAPVRPSRHDSQSVPSGSQDSLRVAYENYRNAWRALLAELRYRLERAATGRRSDVLDQLVQDYPDIGREAEFRALISELGISPLRTGVPEMEDWLRRLTDNMFPPPNASINLALAMERIGEVLEVFATAFVEMRDAHGRLCNEM